MTHQAGFALSKPGRSSGMSRPEEQAALVQGDDLQRHGCHDPVDLLLQFSQALCCRGEAGQTGIFSQPFKGRAG